MGPDFDGMGLRIGGMVHLAPREAARAAAEGAAIVDLRELHGRTGRSFAVPEVIDLPWRRFAGGVDGLPRDRALVVADQVGVHSREAVAILIARGHPRVANLVGGIVAWEAAGCPTEVRRGEELIGGCACRLHPRDAEG